MNQELVSKGDLPRAVSRRLGPLCSACTKNHYSLAEAPLVTEADLGIRRADEKYLEECLSATVVRTTWPIQLLTFGRFSVIKDGIPLAFSHETPTKPITLLKALLALGGRDVIGRELSDKLWPDVEGDAAHDVLAVNVHRLRRLIGVPDAVLVHDGRLTLDPLRCWVDAWAFQRLIGHASYGCGDERAQLLAHALPLYRGAFLDRDREELWTLTMRERLRSMFLRHSAELGRLREDVGQWEQAIECYQRAIETDELGENCYQGLMRCYRHLNRCAEGLAVYRRLRQTLSVILGVMPSPASEMLRELLA
jgi:LuxR family maltose regulon positive regulatory protein